MTSTIRGNRWLMLAAMMLLALAPAAQALAQAPRVAEIEVRGNQRINREAILAVVTTKVGDEISPERLERDRLAIDALGWFQAVTINPQPLPGGGYRISIVVNEFPVVKSLDITGSTLFSDEQTRALLKTKTGQIFNRIDFEADLEAIRRLYLDKGYQVRILYNADQPEFLEQGVLKAEVQELKVGALKLKWPTREIKDKQGNVVRREESHKTRNYVVMRELSQRPGALYNVNQLQRDYRTLAALGFFEAINPVVEVEQDLTVSITWELTEKRTGQVSVGAGYSPRQQLVGRAELADQNFRGKGQGVSISGEIGSFGGDGAPSVELSFHEPWLTPQKTSMTVEVYNKLVWRFSQSILNRGPRDDDRYTERRFGGTIQFGRPFSWPVTLGLRYDDVNTADLPQQGGGGVRFPTQDGRVVSGNVTRLWNSRDYPNNPTEGGILRLSSEVGHASLDNAANQDFDNSIFNKNVVDYRRYFRTQPLKATKEPEREQESQKVPVVALRLMAGTVIGDVPFFEQFFVGGAESLRGYLEDRFWGQHMFIASAEYRRPLLNRIVGVLFADAGSAWGTRSSFQFSNRRLATDFEQHQGFKLFPSVGLGIRVATPIGPIRLDYGFGTEGGRTHFSIGHAF